MGDLYFWSANLVLPDNHIQQIHGFVEYKINYKANLNEEGNNILKLVNNKIKKNNVNNYYVIITCISKL